MPWQALEPAAFPFLDYRRFTFSLGIDTPRGLWLAGNTAARFDEARGGMVVEGDLVAQAGVAYDKLAASLGAAGLGSGSIVRAVEYVVPRALADYPRLAALRAARFGTELPATTTVVVDRLLRPEALIEVEAVAARGPSVATPLAGALDVPAGTPPRRAGDVLYIPALGAVDPGSGAILAPGSVAGQAEVIFDRSRRLLAAAGLGFEHVVRTAEWLVPAALPAYRDTAAVRRRFLAAPYPAATGIVMPRLAHPEALLQVEFVAVAGHPRRAVNPGWPESATRTYAPAAAAGGVLYLSGRAAIDPRTGELAHPGDVVAQTRYVYARLGEILEAAGASAAHVVKTTEYIVPAALADYRRTAEVRREAFRPPFPAATGVVCERLLRDGALIEVEAVAVLG